MTPRVIRLAWIDFDIDQRRFVLRAAVRALSLGVKIDRKSPCRSGLESELCNCARRGQSFDVIAVKVQDHGPIRRPAQRHDIPFFHANEPHAVRNVAIFDLQIEDELCGRCRKTRRQNTSLEKCKLTKAKTGAPGGGPLRGRQESIRWLISFTVLGCSLPSR